MRDNDGDTPSPGPDMHDGAATETLPLIQQCRIEALALLRRNLTPHGILAASPNARAAARGYDAVFARDAAICIPAMTLSADPQLVEGARASLLTLARHQAENGQIPKFVDPARQDSDFWYVGCIDATLWWLVALRFFCAHVPGTDLGETLAERVQRALWWLRCQEHPRLHLLQQNEASDWADIMPRSGFVLYSNALWYYVKRLYEVPGPDATRRHFNRLFHPFSADLPEYRRLRLLTRYVLDGADDRELYLSFVNFSFWGEEGDVFGNLLALLFDLADAAQHRQVLETLLRERIDEPHPVRVTCKPIARRDPLWRRYMDRHEQNLEHQYHNGGVWPFVGGFWILALARAGERQRAYEQLLRLAQANQVGGWRFTEWFHGRTGAPRGMRGQSWNAAMFLLAQYGLDHPVFELPGHAGKSP